MNLEEKIEKYKTSSIFRAKEKAKKLWKKWKFIPLVSLIALWMNYSMNAIDEVKRERRIIPEEAFFEAREKDERNREELARNLITGFGTAYALMLAYGLRKKRERFIDYLEEPLIENRNITSLIVGGVIGYACYKAFGGSVYNYSYDIQLKMGVIGGSIFSFFTNVILENISDAKTPALLNKIKMNLILSKHSYKIESMPDKDLEGYCSTKKLTKSDKEYTQALRSFHSNYDKAFLDLQQMYACLLYPEPESKGFSAVFTEGLIDFFTKYIVLAQKPSPERTIDTSIISYRDGKYKEVLESIKSLATRDFEAEGRLSYTLFLNALVRKAVREPENVDIQGIVELGNLEKKLEESWQETLNAILERKDIENVDRRVKAVVRSEFLNKSIRLKEGSREEFEESMKIAKQIELLTQECQKFDIARPLAIVSRKGTTYLVTMYSEGRNLYEANDEVFDTVAKYMRLLHDNVVSFKPKRNERRVIEGRIERANFLSPVLREEKWKALWQESCDYVWDGDFHGGNFIWHPGTFIDVFDTEDKGTSPRYRDVNKCTVESSIRGDWEKTLRFIKSYGKNGDFEKAVLINRIPYALSYFVHSLEKGRGSPEQRRVALEAGINSIRLLPEFKELEPYLIKCLRCC